MTQHPVGARPKRTRIGASVRARRSPTRALLLAALCLAATGCLRTTDDLPPLGEICNGVDDDNDGLLDEAPIAELCPAFDDNPGTGERACVDGRCIIATCNPGHNDLDGGRLGDPAGYRNGCETICTPTVERVDVCIGGLTDCADNCDNADDDCDGLVDEGREMPLTLDPGVCGGQPMTCFGRWSGPDPATIEGYEEVEVTADCRDNDCDGLIDEGHPDDQCDMRDDDCDGLVDEDADCGYMRCAAGTEGPPCNGCPAGTVIPGDGDGWVCVPPGTYTRGSPRDEPGRDDDEGPRRRVTLERPLLVQVHEVTQAQWQAAFETLPSTPTPCADCPVVSVSWLDAAHYLNRLSADAGFSPCYRFADDCPAAFERGACVVERVDRCTGFRLPTEAEWEYLARGGTDTAWWSGPDEADLARVGWYSANSGDRAHAVCTLPAEPPAHPWGLCDVHGNVWEWTDSWYGAYSEDGPIEPPEPDPDSGADRVARGGSYRYDPASARSASRNAFSPTARTWFIGFRPVRALGGR